MKKRKIIFCSILIIVIFLLMPIGINLLASIPNPLLKGNPNTVEATWIGFWGSYLGGFLSALVGAGVSGLFAYLLIGKQAEANRNSQILQEISLSFNKEFQKVKQDIIENTTQMHTLLQIYHMRLVNQEEFSKRYNELMDRFGVIETELHTVINSNVVLLQYVKANALSFDNDGIKNKLTMCALNCNKLRENQVIFTSQGKSFDIVEFYNTNCLPYLNELRKELIEFEYNIIDVLFPALKTSKKFGLVDLETVEETDYDTALEKALSNIH